MRFPSALTPLAHGQFAWFCTATTTAGLGAWIQSTASAWVMTELAPDPIMVSLVQAAAQLPVLLLVVPAGALADLVNRRRYLILTNAWMFFIAALLAGLYALGQVGPWLLLVLTALLAAGAALNSPAWSSSLTQMVPRDALAQAVAVNTMSFNVARAVGPSLGGILVAVGGAALAFAANAVSFAIVAIICGAVLSLTTASRPDGLTAEPKGRAILLGVRYVAAEPNLRAAMVRSLAFYGMASAIWALLPLYVRQVLGLSAASYGALLGATGVGALVGGLVMPHIRAWLSRDGEVMLGGILCSATLIPVALLPSPGCGRLCYGRVRLRVDPCDLQSDGGRAIGERTLGTLRGAQRCTRPFSAPGWALAPSSGDGWPKARDCPGRSSPQDWAASRWPSSDVPTP